MAQAFVGADRGTRFQLRVSSLLSAVHSARNLAVLCLGCAECLNGNQIDDQSGCNALSVTTIVYETTPKLA